VRVANLAHYGHITHLEGGFSMFQKIKESSLAIKDPLALFFGLFIHTCDVAGALGHVNFQSSLAYTEVTHRAMHAMNEAVRLLSDPSKNEEDAYNEYLKKRMKWLGLDFSNRADQVLGRVGAMLRLFTKEEGKLLRKAIAEIPSSMRDRIATQFNAAQQSLCRTPTYMPALLVNLANNFTLGATKEERLSKAVILGLPFITRVLEKQAELVQKDKSRATIPLNFNEVAGVVKTAPESLNGSGYIDEEGSVHLD
jgi:hypothetical protein